MSQPNGKFPIQASPADGRFGFGVTAEVAKVLASFGFPDIMSFYEDAWADFEQLQRALATFVYGPHPAEPLAEMQLSEWMAVAESSLTAETAPTPIRPHGAPVEFRLISNPRACSAAAEVLGHVFNLTYASDPLPTRDGRVRIYLTGHRAAPYKGGIK